jgi:hypothetical protein
MNIPANSTEVRAWIDPPSGDDRPVPGYDEWVAKDIAAGLQDFKVGKVHSHDAIRKEFGLE